MEKTQTCRVCQRPEECAKAQFCRYPLVGRPETAAELTAKELFSFAMKQLD